MQEMQQRWVLSLGWEDPLEEGMATHSMDVLVNVDSVFSGHHLVDGGPALLLSTLLCRSHFCRTGVQDYGRRNTVS